MTKKLVMVVGFLVAVAASQLMQPYQIDLGQHFLPAAEALLAGKNPYKTNGFYSPPWLLAIIIPFTMMPYEVAALLWAVLWMGIAMFAYNKLGEAGWIIALNPFVFFGVTHGNIDAVIPLGVILPPSLGIWALLLKPQIALGGILYWMHKREGKHPLFVLPFLILSLAPLVGWFQRPILNEMFWNAALPSEMGIPVGVVLFLWGMKRDNILLCIAASPFISPYLAIHSWSIALLPAVKYPKIAGAIVVGLWAITLFFLITQGVKR